MKTATLIPPAVHAFLVLVMISFVPIILPRLLWKNFPFDRESDWVRIWGGHVGNLEGILFLILSAFSGYHLGVASSGRPPAIIVALIVTALFWVVLRWFSPAITDSRALKYIDVLSKPQLSLAVIAGGIAFANIGQEMRRRILSHANLAVALGRPSRPFGIVWFFHHVEGLRLLT